MKNFLDACQIYYINIKAHTFQFYLELVKHTSAFHVDCISSLVKEVNQGSSVILAIWHGEVLLHFLLPYCLDSHALFHHRPKFYSLVSDHLEAEFYARLVANLGHGVLRPASEKMMVGQLLVAKKLLAVPRNLILIAVDGPNGPGGVAKAGAVMLAKISGAPLIPLHCEVRRILRRPTWDEQKYPLPFNRFTFKCGHAIYVSPDIDRTGMNAIMLRLQSELNGLHSTNSDSFEWIDNIHKDTELSGYNRRKSMQRFLHYAFIAILAYVLAGQLAWLYAMYRVKKSDELAQQRLVQT